MLVLTRSRGESTTLSRGGKILAVVRVVAVEVTTSACGLPAPMVFLSVTGRKDRIALRVNEEAEIELAGLDAPVRVMAVEILDQLRKARIGFEAPPDVAIVRDNAKSVEPRKRVA